ncbi:hypothetical protein TYRP_022708 [Tyrophagus putrescentiae]|nr:hypothetical protein TYRP_022708 [Tyrophagus putrescentiae]
MHNSNNSSSSSSSNGSSSSSNGNNSSSSSNGSSSSSSSKEAIQIYFNLQRRVVLLQITIAAAAIATQLSGRLVNPQT